MARRLDYNATLTAREDLNPDLAVFHARHDEPWGRSGRPPFVAGQYVAIGLNNAREPALGGVRRSMSIASAPEEREALQFYVRLVREPTSKNPLTPLLWGLRPGGRLFMTRRAVGKLTLAATVGERDRRCVLMVAAGTGLAPFVSMVRSARLRDPGVDLGRFAIFHGASYPRDLAYREELRGYAREHGLHYFATVSRPAEAPDWEGDHGRVEDYFADHRIADTEARLGLGRGELAPARAGVLVCGLEGTLASTLSNLLARGFVPEQRRVRRLLDVPDEHPPALWWEQYDAAPVVDPDDAAGIERMRARLAGAA